MYNLNGFRASHRNRWYLVRDHFLTLQQFTLFEFYIDQADYDGHHKKFGAFEVYFDDIATIFGKSVDTIRSWHNQLVEKRLIREFDKKRKYCCICRPQRYGIDKSKKGDAYFQAEIEKVVSTTEMLLPFIQFSPLTDENTPENIPNLLKDSSPKALVSSKEESRFSPPITEDRTIIEDIDIVNLYFGGDWEEFRKQTDKEFPNQLANSNKKEAKAK